MTRKSETKSEYARVWRVVDGALKDAFKRHPKFFSRKYRWRDMRHSLTKRVVGQLYGYAKSAWSREVATETPCAIQKNGAAVASVSEAADVGADHMQTVCPDCSRDIHTFVLRAYPKIVCRPHRKKTDEELVALHKRYAFDASRDDAQDRVRDFAQLRCREIAYEQSKRRHREHA